ncbi:MAG: LysE family transporter [Rhodospirillales bacterium]|nr:LysE family transporter [Rhodospirillales bacterium]MCB9995104.1 LysE family transporter [Rhodospirillales bacterium]
MDQILGLLLVYAVFIGALASPGPDLLITMRNALGYSARAGVFTALGIAVALIIHMSYCVAGIGLVISQSIILFNLIKWLGAAYLIYIGVHALRSKGASLKAEEITGDLKTKVKTDKAAFISGFITNLFNPKATMFFLALFSQMIDPALPLSITVAFCAACIVTAFTWFSAVSFVLSVPVARRGYARASKWIDRVFGAFFVALGVKLAFAKA